jgi:hypothetical protein
LSAVRSYYTTALDFFQTFSVFISGYLKMGNVSYLLNISIIVILFCHFKYDYSWVKTDSFIPFYFTETVATPKGLECLNIIVRGRQNRNEGYNVLGLSVI